ncbi:MAG: homogentisate 1,2-dioxygenase [Alphaproteobacteria bacterium]|nr:MAG: homogentisate 1,2-dioxygenase [Alphaproteobacteria bacterium]TAF14762.1 MAG: homogentisate 1,2-dioxygenase [Alphaproteobacteria bacterium]TAF76082.1 MAG: homogentisate 1,2-dioxygenase [Alphaproteobacteria bacterium]
MKKYISFPLVQGTASRQAHADLPEGTYEREISKEGFFGPASFMYHPKPPTGWSAFEGPLRPRAFDLTKIGVMQHSPWHTDRILYNAHTEVRYWTLDAVMPSLVRNADGDQLLFIHRGDGDLYCDYGHLAYETGDYIMIPRSTMWRLEPHTVTEMLMIEATNNHYKLPDKGLLGGHAIFDPAMLDIPQMNDAFVAQKHDRQTRVEIKKLGVVSVATYPYNPLDAIGWHGDLCVVRLNVRHIRPILSDRYHVPPSVHTTFVTDRFVVCTFAPRPFEGDAGAIKIPFFHNNDDYDEVLFYHAGDFFSRDHIEAGMMTYHPCGFTHGPHPKALKNMLKQSKPATDEYAVMLDTRDALHVGERMADVELKEYVDSWKNNKI